MLGKQSLLKMNDLPVELIIQIMSYMYPCYVFDKLASHGSPHSLLHNNKIRKQCMDIINLSTVCKYFNNIVRENGMKVIYFDKNIKIDIINKYKSKYLIAPSDEKLNDSQLKSLTNLTYLHLYWNEYITDGGIKPLTNLTHLVLWQNENITDGGIKPLTNLTYLNLDSNGNITDFGIKPLTNLTHLNYGVIKI